MKHLPLLVFFLLGFSRLATAAATVTALTPASRAWVTLSVLVLPAGTAEITLQDARGGPAISRKVSDSSHAVLTALPLIAPAELSGGRWPVTLVARGVSGEILEKSAISLTLPATAAFRIAVPPGAQSQAAALGWPAASLDMPAISPEEFVSAPAQAFAGFDGLCITPDMASKLDESRILALLAAGPSVVLLTPQPLAGTSRLTWTRIDKDAAPAWLCTSKVPPPLPLVAADLAQLHLEARVDTAPIKNALLLLGPAALFLAIISRALFRRPTVVLASTAAAFLALAAGTLAWLRSTDLQTQVLAQWTLTLAAETPAAGIDVPTQITSSTTLFGSVLDLESPTLSPLAATPRAWWNLSNTSLALDPHSIHLRGTLEPRQRILVQRSRFAIANLVPVFPSTTAERIRFGESMHARADASGWVSRGYVYPVAATSLEGEGTVFSAWARQFPACRPGLDAWYALQFRADRRYLIVVEEQVAHVVEFP